jgi:hypothetical protein
MRPFKTLSGCIQRYLVLAYSESRRNSPSFGDRYWTIFAISDAALILFLGPLTAWLPVVAIKRTFGSDGAVIFAWAVIGAGIVAFILTLWISRRVSWKEAAKDTRMLQPRPYELMLWRSCALVTWTLINPLIWWELLPRG